MAVASASTASSRARRSPNGASSNDSSPEREQVERDERRRDLHRELLARATRPGCWRSCSASKSSPRSFATTSSPSSTHAVGQLREQRLAQLGEVPQQRLAVAALQIEVVAVAEHDAAEAVPLRLVRHRARRRQLARELREHRLDAAAEPGASSTRRLASTSVTRSATSSSRSPVARTLRSTTPRRETLGADDELHRHAEQVGVGELHAGARIAVVEQHRDAARLAARRTDASAAATTVARRVAAPGQHDEVHVVRRERRRPRQPVRRRGTPRRRPRRSARCRCRSNPSASGAARRLRRCKRASSASEYFVPSWNTCPTSMPRSTDERVARSAGTGRPARS